MNSDSFGKRLKELRHSKNMTQVQLADFLAVSPQAVSKWENDIGYPDLPLLAPISDIFGISIDALLGNNGKENDIKQAREKTEKLWQEERNTAAECIAIWRELLRKYPADDECRNALAFELVADWKDMSPAELKKCAQEAVSLYESVLDESRDSKQLSIARCQIVWVYAQLLNEPELASKHAQNAGNPECNTPHLMTLIQNHPEQKHWQQYEVWYMTGGLAWAIANQKYDSPQRSIFAYRTALKIIDTVCYNGSYAYFDSCYAAYFWRSICELRASGGDFTEDIYEDIKAMVASCRRADEMPLGKRSFEGNLFMDLICYEHTLHDTQMQFAKELLEESIFDTIRENAQFVEVYESLK